jgi:hypothetical protein
MNVTMEWSEPPTPSRQGKWGPIYKELEARPSEWAKISEGRKRNTYSLASRLRKEAGPGFEFTSRTLGEDLAGVWGRYVGDANEPQVAPVEMAGEHGNMQPEELPDPL